MSHNIPFFVEEDGLPLLRNVLVERMRVALESLGVPAARYNGHSFRIGAAMTAEEQGFED